MANPSFSTSPKILYMKKIILIRADKTKKSKKTSDDDLYTVPDNVVSKDKVEPRRSERLQIKQLTNETYMSSNLFYFNDEIKWDQDKKTGKKLSGKLGTDGWCTPWAEILDQIDIYYLGIHDTTVLTTARKYAKNLGAKETENINEATHIITEPTIDISIIKSSVTIH